jgi:hypothetical protein
LIGEINVFDKQDHVVLGIIIAVALFLNYLIGVYLGSEQSENKIQKEAIERGCAQFNPNDGKFEWKN